jgi:hypothetical protein
MNDAKLPMEGYLMFRKDRLGEKGVEAILYINDNLVARSDDSCSKVKFEESIWCTVEVGKHNLLVDRKSSSDELNNEKLLQVIDLAANLRDVDHFIIFRDFNYPEVDYNADFISFGLQTAPYRFFDMMNGPFLVQNVLWFKRQREDQNPSILIISYR